MYQKVLKKYFHFFYLIDVITKAYSYLNVILNVKKKNGETSA